MKAVVHGTTFIAAVFIVLAMVDIVSSREVHKGRVFVKEKVYREPPPKPPMDHVLVASIDGVPERIMVSGDLWHKLQVGDKVEIVRTEGLLVRGHFRVVENGGTIIRAGAIPDEVT